MCNQKYHLDLKFRFYLSKYNDQETQKDLYIIVLRGRVILSGNNTYLAHQQRYRTSNSNQI